MNFKVFEFKYDTPHSDGSLLIAAIDEATALRYVKNVKNQYDIWKYVGQIKELTYTSHNKKDDIIEILETSCWEG